ncbi:hypothetical protein RB653_002124 [Dictyostelium firmibasis]|uniref:NAD-dependent epimerase/dehydratase domain-containing protein n=1 Tax=Dictyostelium firmibasis TaxID=79012 RepID=A0AAN7YPS2_9MYCE
MINQDQIIIIYGGKTGWIGQKIVELLKVKGVQYYISECRLENRESILKELDEIKPLSVINCAGVTGRPNVDWCEDNKQETIRSNVIGTLNLIDCCYLRSIHITNFATGCIYKYDEKHPMNSGIGFKEDEEFNYFDSHYSVTKQMVETLTKHYENNTLTLRLRMPISENLNEPRNFITKITKYEKVVNIPNSCSVLPDLLPIAIDMTIKQIKGVFNFVNPGVISHNQILDLYIQHVNQTFKYQNFTEEEQSKILKCGRSNNHLDTSKLESLYPLIPNIKNSIENIFLNLKK